MPLGRKSNGYDFLRQFFVEEGEPAATSGEIAPDLEDWALPSPGEAALGFLKETWKQLNDPKRGPFGGKRLEDMEKGEAREALVQMALEAGGWSTGLAGMTKTAGVRMLEEEALTGKLTGLFPTGKTFQKKYQQMMDVAENAPEEFFAPTQRFKIVRPAKETYSGLASWDHAMKGTEISLNTNKKYFGWEPSTLKHETIHSFDNYFRYVAPKPPVMNSLTERLGNLEYLMRQARDEGIANPQAVYEMLPAERLAWSNEGRVMDKQFFAGLSGGKYFRDMSRYADEAEFFLEDVFEGVTKQSPTIDSLKVYFDEVLGRNK